MLAANALAIILCSLGAIPVTTAAPAENQIADEREEKAIEQRSSLFGQRIDSTDVRPAQTVPDLRSRCYADSPPSCWTVPAAPENRERPTVYRTGG